MAFLEFRNTDTDIEENSRWRDFELKQQHYTLKKGEHRQKAQ